MKTLIAITALAVTGLYFGGCNYRNVDVIKANAPKAWSDAGFEIVGYEGYQIGGLQAPGGLVWYVVQRTGDSTIRYNGAVSKWGGEYHLYEIQALDAIAPNR